MLFSLLRRIGGSKCISMVKTKKTQAELNRLQTINHTFFICAQEIFARMAALNHIHGPCNLQWQVLFFLHWWMVLHFVFRGLYRNGGSKFISLALVKANPRNELRDLISETCVKLNKFGILKRNHLVSWVFFARMFTRMAVRNSYLWPLWRQIHGRSWEIWFQNLG